MLQEAAAEHPRTPPGAAQAHPCLALASGVLTLGAPAGGGQAATTSCQASSIASRFGVQVCRCTSEPAMAFRLPSLSAFTSAWFLISEGFTAALEVP